MAVWYVADMIGMSRSLLMGLLLYGMFPLSSRAQDIASPGIPNLHLNSEAGKKLQEGRRAIGVFLAVLCLDEVILMLEDDHEVNMDRQKRVKHLLESIPMNALSRCPEDFRCAVRQWKNTCEKMLEESRAISESGGIGMGERVNLLMEKYRMEETIEPMTDWVFRKTGVFPLTGEGDADKEEILKRLKEFREKMASGEVVIPVEILEQEEEQGAGANV